MKTRHKIPAVFSIYMVDVLCCALGCVILLWQLYHQESAEQTAKNEVIHKENEDFLQKLAQANLSLSSLNSDLESLKGKLDASEKKQTQITIELDKTRNDRDKAARLALVRKQEYDDMKKTLVSAEAMLALLRLDLKKQEQKNSLTAEELADKIRSHADLFDKLAVAEKKIRALIKDLNLKNSDTQIALKRAEEKSTLVQLLEQELMLLRSQNKETMTKIATADLRVNVLEKDLDRSRKELLDAKRYTTDVDQAQLSLKQRLANLEKDRISLLKKAATAENRFAGITLTGRRVIFLVDMSGSMEMVDEKTYDPDKWPIVCDTVARIMSSLPDLREYQVIVFSDRFRYAFGKDGSWLEYNPETSAKKVAEGLKAIKPKGGTDMYAAFQEVFRFRNLGLDTVYLFSDGLPNMGEGLPANADKLSESQRCEMLGKHIRGQLKSNWNQSQTSQPRVRINCVGFFFESPDLGAFLWALAREHEGSFVGMSRP